MTSWLIAIPRRRSLAFMPPTASFSNTLRRVESANALSLSMLTDNTETR